MYRLHFSPRASLEAPLTRQENERHLITALLVLGRDQSSVCEIKQSHTVQSLYNAITLGRRQSKMLSTMDERRSKIDRNSVFDCHLSPVGRQMAIENTVSIDF